MKIDDIQNNLNGDGASVASEFYSDGLRLESENRFSESDGLIRSPSESVRSPFGVRRKSDNFRRLFFFVGLQKRPMDSDRTRRTSDWSPSDSNRTFRSPNKLLDFSDFFSDFLKNF